jgi:hypothetical protein
MLKRTRTFEATMEGCLKAYKSDYQYGRWTRMPGCSVLPGIWYLT